MATVVLLGNNNPMHQYPEGARKADHLEQSVTRVELWDGHNDPDFVELTLSTENDRILTNINRVLEATDPDHRVHSIAIHELEQLWPYHGGGSKPDWVEGERDEEGNLLNPGLMKAISDYYNIPVGQPTNLLTNAGRDALHQQLLTTGSQPAAFNYIALTASTTSPSSSDTSLSGEITTSGGGLVRAQATFAHTTGTNTSTLTKTYTANSNDTLPVTIAQIGVFNAASSGTICFHTALSGTATLSVPGDNLTCTEQVTAG